MLDNPHAKGMLMAYVPDAKLGWVTDVWNPGQPLPEKPNAGIMSVVNTVKRTGIEPERFAGGHGSSADYASPAGGTYRISVVKSYHVPKTRNEKGADRADLQACLLL